MVEHTVNTNEKGRIPTATEAEGIEVATAGAQNVFLGWPILADPDRLVTTIVWGDGTLTIAAQNDVPRNLTATLTDANDSVTAGILTAVGVDPLGRAISEVLIDLTVAKTGTGTKIFATVTSLIITATAGTPAGGTDMLVVGCGNVIGTPFDLGVTAEVIHAYVGPVKVTPDAIAVGASLSGVDCNGGTYDGAKVMWAIINTTKNA